MPMYDADGEPGVALDRVSVWVPDVGGGTREEQYLFESPVYARVEYGALLLHRGKHKILKAPGMWAEVYVNGS